MSFYKEMSKNNFMEKTASENNEIKETLSGLSPEILQKLANEIDNIESDGMKSSLETIASECGSDGKSTEDEGKSEDKSEEKKEAEEEGKSEECKSEECKSEDKPEEKKEAEDEGEIPNGEKSEEEVKKEAYELASQRLEKAGYTVADYVYSKTADEEISEYVSKTAEVIADMTEKTALEVADDILGALNEKLV